MGYSAAPSQNTQNGMSALPSETAPEDNGERRKKLKFRAWRRGFREIDLILGPFADQRLAELDASGLDAFETLMHAPDQDVYDWITEAQAPPAEYDTPILHMIRAFRHEIASTRA
jgi:antitoxin CptB